MQEAQISAAVAQLGLNRWYLVIQSEFAPRTKHHALRVSHSGAPRAQINTVVTFADTGERFEVLPVSIFGCASIDGCMTTQDGSADAVFGTGAPGRNRACAPHGRRGQSPLSSDPNSRNPKPETRT